MSKQYYYLVQKSLAREQCIKYTQIGKESGSQKNTYCIGLKDAVLDSLAT